MPKLRKTRQEILSKILEFIHILEKQGWTAREMSDVLSPSHTVISQILNKTYPHITFDNKKKK